ncbi:carboxypeptidase-like regulatory domain-containing protein [Flavobacteriaceae bacterium 3-367]|uniref:carboxypeptidase-like regulatory domain-containing protein n=1 Tax=Eudoraea algarum TaxID=3417568 RepID=UPI0032775376
MKAIFTFCALFLTTFLCAQQQGSITGRVLDKEMNNEPLLFANITVKNTTKRTQTNFHGNFEFSDMDTGTYVLLISYPGYAPLEVPVTVKENEVTEIHKGLGALSISMEGIGLSTDAETGGQTSGLVSTKFKGQK